MKRRSEEKVVRALFQMRSNEYKIEMAQTGFGDSSLYSDFMLHYLYIETKKASTVVRLS